MAIRLILLQKALNCTSFSCIWIAFWSKGLVASPLKIPQYAIWLLKLVTKFSQITSEKIIRTLHQYGFLHFSCSFDYYFLLRKQFSQFIRCFLHATTEGSSHYGYKSNSVSRSSFSHLKSKLSISRKLISPFRIDILLHGTSHVADPNLLLVFRFEYQVGSSCCLSFPQIELKIPGKTSFTLLFFKSIPRSHRSLYHTVLAPINFCSFAQVTVSIISAVSC